MNVQVAELPPALMLLRAIAGRLDHYQYRYSGDPALHDLIAETLHEGGFSFLRRPILAGRFRPSFWLPTDPIGHGVVVEVKTHGTQRAALRAVDRYIAEPAVAGVLIATTRRWSGDGMEDFARRVQKPVGLTYLARKA